MKQLKLLSLATLLLMAAGCIQEIQEIVDYGTIGEPMVFEAGWGDSPSTRTAIQKNGTSIWWTGEETINVFYGNRFSGQFVSTNTEAVNRTTFTGTLSVVTGTIEEGNGASSFWAVYPYAAANSCDGENVTLTVAAEQAGKDGSFADNSFPAIAQSPGLDLAFYNVCGGVAFSLTREDIVKVTLQGNGGEALAGQVKVAFDDQGHPAVESCLSPITEVTLAAPGGGCFKKDVMYYLVTLPVALTSGYKIAFYTETAKATRRSTTPVEVHRSAFGRLLHADEGLVFIPTTGVDLGLSVRWAPCNVGAEEEWEKGGRYAWGELEEKNHYNWDNYKWCNGSVYSMTKYCTSSNYGTLDGKTRLEPKDDVAAVLMGDGWRMPTSAEMTELTRNCTWTKTTSNGVSGYRVTGPNGNSIFIPVSGQYDESGLVHKTTEFLWTSDTDGTYWGYALNGKYVSSNHRHDGLMVRGVYGKATQEETIITLSEEGTANCYIVPKAGKYSFRADVKGSSLESVGNPVSAQVLWESFGTAETPQARSLIQTVSFADGFVTFETPDVMKNGNAVIAVKDSGGNILWSWHIWLCEGYDPDETDQVYKNGAGTMMDRNLGSISVTPGEVGCLGLLYQWGRKDPFLGAAKTTYSSSGNQEKAASNANWPTSVASSATYGNESYTTAHPMTYVTQNTSNHDWYYGTGGNRWTPSTSEKSVQDPCPFGYRVPDGGSNGIWETAGYTSSLDQSTMTMRVYILQSSGYATYPAAGFLMRESGALNYAGYNGLMWSATSSTSGMAYYMDFNLGSTSMRTFHAYKADARPVRCVKMEVTEPTQPVTHEYVDLGLSVKWATCNVGASKPEESGEYFAWGEIVTKEDFSWETYKWCNGSSEMLTKYNFNSSYGTVDNKTTLDPEDDAAYANWGGSWRMPTYTELAELYNNCTVESVSENGVSGWRFTSKKTGYTGKSIFLPAAGRRVGTNISQDGSVGWYWSSSLSTYDTKPIRAADMDFSSGLTDWRFGDFRHQGQTVRPVCK